LPFEAEILQEFSILRLTPRFHQIEAISQVLKAFLIDRNRIVVLSAPTGAGKSLIATIVGIILDKHSPYQAERFKSTGSKPQEPFPTALYVSATNVLGQQYADSFKKIGIRSFLAVRGAGTYRCEYLTQKDGVETDGESCVFAELKLANNGAEHPLCSSCGLRIQRREKNARQHVSTNYSYFFLQNLYVKQQNKYASLLERSLVVWDEAQLANDMYCEHAGVFYNEKTIESFKNDGEKYFSPQLWNEQYKEGHDYLRENLRNCNEKNYLEYLDILYPWLEQMRDHFEVLRDRMKERNLFGEVKEDKVAEENLRAYRAYNSRYKKYQGLACKISDFRRYNYAHVFDGTDGIYSIKPIFMQAVKDVMMESGDHHLLMSATLSPSIIQLVFGFKKDEFFYIKLPPVFDPAHKLIDFAEPLNLNYETLKQSWTLDKISEKVLQILNVHEGLNEKGLIQVPSFYLQDEIVKRISGKTNVKIVQHERSLGMADALKTFKRTERPAVFISPSIFEGVDLPGDESSFQILVKAPFPSLADKRIAYILDHHKAFFEEITILKMIQALGRSVRSETDFCISYLLDTNLVRLFRSPRNLWQDEFEIM